MPRTDLFRWSVQFAADISAYAASLPQQYLAGELGPAKV